MSSAPGARPRTLAGGRVPRAGSHAPVALLAALLLASIGCASSGGAHARHQKRIKPEEGIASWYGSDYHGKATASGEIYDMHALTMAHRTLPLGTLVEVRNLENGRTVVVRVNDRGPFVRGRIADLSLAAAQALAFDRDGLARVRLTVVEGKAAPPPKPPTYWVQVGAFRQREKALELQADLVRRYPGTTVRSDHDWYRVQVPSGDKRRQAEALSRELRRHGFDTVLVRQPRSKT